MDYSAAAAAASASFPTMDSIVQHHAGSLHNHQASPAFELDDDELRKYLASPQSASAPTPQDQHNHSKMEQMSTASMATDGTLLAAAAPATPAGSLESALAALGETGRQQLLAILQLANNPKAGEGATTTTSNVPYGGASNVQNMAAGAAGFAPHSRSGSISAPAAVAPAGGGAGGTGGQVGPVNASNASMTGVQDGMLQQAMAQQMQIQMALQLQRQQLAHSHQDPASTQQFAFPGHSAASSISSSASPSNNPAYQQQVLQYQAHATHFPAHPQNHHHQQQQQQQQQQGPSSVPPTPVVGSFGSSGSGSGPSSVPPSPAFFANAFNQYASGRQHANGNGNGNGNGHGNAGIGGAGRHSNKDGSTPSSSSSKPSPALSAITSYSNPTSSKHSAGARHPTQRQGSGSAGGGGGGEGAGRRTKYSSSSSSGYGHAIGNGNGNGGSANAKLDNLSFTLPDATYYRSPAVAPGTSSSAFYTESNLGDESDLLFTPLLSPALTASTHPGPSVGPLPESFANLGKDFAPPSGQPADGQHPGSTVVSPSNFFSPLTSPALRPQTHAQAQDDGSQPQPQPQSQLQHLRSTVASPRTFTNGQPARTSTLKGASKNAPKTRPSPIIRPTDMSSGTFSKPSSKRHTPSTSMSSPAAGPGIHGPLSTNGMSSHIATSTSPNAGANNYGHPVSQSSSYASLLNNLARIHEHAAQDALQDSPSPQQFDMSSATSASAYLGGLMGQATASNPYAFAQEQQRMSDTSKQSEGGSDSPYKQESQPNSNIPSPLDLNSFFGMLGGVATDAAVGPAVVAGPDSAQTHQMRVDSGSQSAPASATEQGRAQTSTFDFNDYASFFQNPANTAQALTNPLAHFLLANSAGADTAPGAGGQSSNNTGSAPLTPASFMNLPQNQYNLLTGLLADHSQKPQLAHQAAPNVSSGTTPQPRSQPASAGPSPRIRPQGQGIPTDGTTSAATTKGQRSQPHSVQQSPRILPTYHNGARGPKMPISPALLAQNITEVAAAAIAAKEAKSAAKGRGSGRKRAQSSTVSKESGQANGDATASTSAPAPPARKTGKRAAAQAAESAVQASVREDEAAEDAHAMALDASSSTAMPGSGPRTALPSAEQSPVLAAAPPETRKSSHKVAEQRRRDSLKLCFEELRFILPPINPEEDEDFNGGKRPGENNVGGQRGRSQNVDPAHPNRGISKVALLRKSNEYVTKLHERIDKRDRAVETLRAELRLCRAALGHAPADDIVSLDALSAVDWEELEEDHDPVPPTYILHGLCPPGSTLVYRPSQATIPEETASMNEDTRDGQDDESEQEEEEDEYRAKKGKVKRNGSTARRKSGIKA